MSWKKNYLYVKCFSNANRQRLVTRHMERQKSCYLDVSVI